MADRPATAVLLLAMGLLALAGCTAVRVETPDPAAVPSGPLEPAAGLPAGPIVELGSGQDGGIGWRYAIYPSDDGWCTQLEMVAFTAAACGDPLPAEDRAFGSVARGEMTGSGIVPVDGIVSEETVTVWLVDESTALRVPARLMPLDEAGLEGQAFVGFAPEDMTPTHLQAVKANGDILETFELP